VTDMDHIDRQHDTLLGLAVGDDVDATQAVCHCARPFRTAESCWPSTSITRTQIEKPNGPRGVRPLPPRGARPANRLAMVLLAAGPRTGYQD